MAVEESLLRILVCPESKTALTVADKSLVDSLNRKIEQGAIKNRGGETVQDRIDGGLVRADGKYLYPIREDIPVMLIEEAIALN
jgi:uncharacterized protein YbaR (Trm112 family)